MSGLKGFIDKYGPAMSVVLTIIVSAFGLGAKFTAENEKVLGQLTDFNRRLSEQENNTLTIPMAAEHALRMAIANPGMKVPDPRDPNILIEVKPNAPSSFIGR